MGSSVSKILVRDVQQSCDRFLRPRRVALSHDTFSATSYLFYPPLGGPWRERSIQNIKSLWGDFMLSGIIGCNDFKYPTFFTGFLYFN